MRERVRRKILDLIVQHDPRTSVKIFPKQKTPGEWTKIYKEGSEIITQWGIIVDEILAIEGLEVLSVDQLNQDRKGEREKIVGILSCALRGAIHYRGEWIIGQNCYLEIPERRRIADKILGEE